MRPDDEAAIVRLLQRLSFHSRFLRFFSGGTNLERIGSWAVDVDYHDRFGIVATAGRDGELVAHASYVRVDADRAEVSFEVADELQGQGIATIMLGQLAEVARENGIPTFTAVVLAENRRMIGVFEESGFPVLRLRADPGEIVAEFPTAFGPDAVERYEQREHLAAVAAVRAFLAPSAVAVIGASRRRGTIGGEIFHNLVSIGFNGPVYPVNPTAEVVQSVAAWRSVADIPGPVDLAVIVVPAGDVVGAARDCAAKGVRSLVVISAGFAESGDLGRERQTELVGVCRDAGMRIIGPNCMGILNTAADVRLDATFGPEFPPTGRIGFMSQSGALGLAVIDHALRAGLGISSFVSVGNKADISGNDLLEYWEDDPSTDVILLYLESFGNPRRFARLTRRIGRTKPIVAVKSGRSTAGARATTSHTGALIAASDLTVDALFSQAGVIRTDSLAELFDVATFLSSQPVPAGQRVGIVTNAGGLGILCADACEASGLVVPALSETARTGLRKILAAEAAIANPIDMIASATPDAYRRVIELIARSGEVDAVVVIFIPPMITDTDAVATAVREAATAIERCVPLVAVFMSGAGAGTGVPTYAFPEDPARVLAHVAQHGSWRGRPQGREVAFEDVRADDAASVLAGSLRDGPRWLAPDAVAGLLTAYGIPVADWALAEDPESAVRAARRLRGAVALKAVARDVIHKTEARAVRLDLRPAGIEKAARSMADDLAASGHPVERFLVQRMVPRGVELLVGVVHDPQFGPVVACGAGGTVAELIKDVQVRIAPLTDLDAADMIRALKTFPLLDGYRGAPKADVASLEELLLRVGAMVDAHREIAELDLNPVVVSSDGAVVVDARVRVETPAPVRPLGARV